ncbi:MAG: cysteine hydrolase family protein [Suipraeoptans sp.]
MKNKLLVVVDMQNDFIDGALGTKEAVEIVPRVVEKINEYKSSGDYVVYTMDTHNADYLNTQEGLKLPVEHCIVGSLGWKLDDKVQEALLDVQTLYGEMIEYKKPSFGSEKLAKMIKVHEEEIGSVELIGLCTGICVISNAVLIKAATPELPITVNQNCCACVTPQSHETAINAMKLLQISIA